MNPLIKKILNESAAPPVEKPGPPLEIIEGERVEYYDICPHCQQEIFERHEYTLDGGETWFHSDCKGPIIFPRKRIREENAKLMSDPNSPWAAIFMEKKK